MLVTSALLIVFAEAGVAQMDMQQKKSSASGATASGALAMVPADFPQLKLAPGFLLRLNVLDDSDFVGTFRVDEHGDIFLPVLGSLHVADETVTEARGQIRRKLLDNRILNDPLVDLSIQEYTAPQVTIIGEVASPGKYPLLVPHSLVDVLALAGGPSITAGNEVLITHGNAGAGPVLVHYSRATNPDAVRDTIVNPGDTVQVKRAGIVYVVGAVNRPGGFVMQEEGTLNVLQAISLASGTSGTASTSTIYLLRRNADGTVVDIAVPYKKIANGKSTDMQLRATDVLYVPTSTFKAIFTNSQAVLNTAASATIYSFVY
jgi:polysaccharide export outer membrane protein